MTAELLSRPSSGKSLSASWCRVEEPRPQKRIWATGLSKTEAEGLLDWLENHAHSNCQVSYVVGDGFTVTE